MRQAIIYCDGQFGSMDGKTANGLIREPGNYEVTAVIDRTKDGLDSGTLLDNNKNGIPICRNLPEAINCSVQTPENFIIGIAPADAFLKENERKVVIQAIKTGMKIINPLQEFLTEDQEIMEYAAACGVTVHDIRKPKPKKEWKLFSGDISHITTPIITVLGTDGACGKRTTAVILEKQLQEQGYKTAFVATGQTGLIQGTPYGFAMDAFPLQFLIGELESEILRANKMEKPDIIIVEGQGALSHPAYASSCAILKGAKPDAVIVQHPPKRKVLGDFPSIKMPNLREEINLIELYGMTKVLAVTLNHEDMTNHELDQAIIEYEDTLKLPVADVLRKDNSKIIDSIVEFFPSLNTKAVVS